MVSFSCEGCGDILKKPKLVQHRSRCSGPFTCLDCNKTMGDGEFQKHTSCISEAQRYEKTVWKGDKPGQNKKGKNGQQQQQGKLQQKQEPTPSVPSTSASGTALTESHGTAVVNGKEANADAPVPAVSESAMSQEGKTVANKQQEKKDKKRKRKADTAADTAEDKTASTADAPEAERKQENGDVSMAVNGEESAKTDANTSEKKKKRKKNKTSKEETPSAAPAAPANGTSSATVLQKALDEALSLGSSINLKSVVEKAQLSAQDVIDLLVIGKGKKSGYTLSLQQ